MSADFQVEECPTEIEGIIAEQRSLLRLLEGNQRALVNRICALEQGTRTTAETPDARRAHFHRDADVVDIRERYRMPPSYDEALRDAFEAGQRHVATLLGVEVQEDDG